MTPIELLAPAKNLECGKAAIDHGADAVYIGAQRFGARAAAGNSIDDIRALCDYARPFNVHVYATVNTIIYDEELEQTEQLVSELYDAGVNAILVQDMGLLRMRRPPIQLHASTQTDNRTVEKVRWLRELGFSRVVLARELSVDEIAQIHAQVPDVELEVFVHGALCVSYSGLCYASQHCFGRSANRGECAQLCRMKYDLIDADGHELEHQRHLLSLKDLCQIDHLEELIRAGATSLKIEGRLKDASYVKNVVAAYSSQLNQLIDHHPTEFCRASKGRCTYTFTPNLQKTFNRGFTTYFLHGRQPDIFSPHTPKAMGEYVGRVKELRNDSLTVAGTASFANGDGLCFMNDQRELEGFRVNRVDGNRLFPLQMPRQLRAGMGLYRNNDQQMERVLSGPSSERKILLSMRLEAVPDGFCLSAKEMVGTDAKNVSVSIASPHQQAEKPQRENIVRQLSKLGGTPYACHEVELPDDFNDFIPSSQLAGMRRMLVERLLATSTNTSAAIQPIASTQPTPPPAYQHTYLYNISNHLACEFYQVKGPTAYELKGGDGPLMQCRHCLRYAMGYCVKHGGRQPHWHEPLTLRLGDGRRFRLEFDCRRCQMNIYSLLLTLLLLVCSSCYNNGPHTPDAWDLTKQQIDSISFSTTHHYTQNYNFVVTGDSLVLTDEPGAILFDSMVVRRHNRLVVAEIQNIPTDTIDSVWVKVARDQQTQGWARERDLLKKVSPDDPISRFIDFFSNAHLLIFLAFTVLVGAAYGVRRLLRMGVHMVHFHDIDSFFPTLLCILVSAAATFYATIQLFGAEQWRHFYYHPSLNPFALPLYLGLFIASVWAILIVAIAAFDDVMRRLPAGEALLYFCGLGAVCAIDYVIFSISTLYYVGYVLLVAYVALALHHYFTHVHYRYHCGQCGEPLHHKGKCPHCGAVNV